MGLAKKIHLTFCYRYFGVLICLTCGAAIFREVEWHKVERDPATQDNAKRNLNTELEKLHQTLSESLNITIDLQLFHNVTRRITNEQTTVGEKRRWTWQQGVHFAFTIMSTIGKSFHRKAMTSPYFNKRVFWFHNKLGMDPYKKDLLLSVLT